MPVVPSAVLTAAEARHLLHRSSFGAPQAQVIAFTGLTRGVAADRLLDFKPQGFKPGGRDHQAIHNKWLGFMLKTKVPFQEKLVLFWHDHFATGIDKVIDPRIMGIQNKLMRQNCKGNLKALVKAMNTDAAMVEYLDTTRNEKEIPNENYARELMELFTLGVKDANGAEAYTQADIVQIARAFTGHRRIGTRTVFDPNRHDFMAEFDGDPGEDRGPKVIFQSTGGFGPGGQDFATPFGEGAREIDAVTDILFAHTDTSGKNTVARRIARRLCEYFAHAEPSQTFVDEVAEETFSGASFAASFEIATVLKAIFCHDDFYKTAVVTPSADATERSVKWPIDFVVSTLRMLQVKPKGGSRYIDGGSYTGLMDQLTNMGQTLMNPPSVFGWDWEASWLSSATLLARYNFARDIGATPSGGGSGFRIDRVIPSIFTLDTAGPIVDAVTGALGVTDYLTAAERTTLLEYLTDTPGAVDGTPVDLDDSFTFDTKLRGLFALVIQSPAYQLH